MAIKKKMVKTEKKAASKVKKEKGKTTRDIRHEHLTDRTAVLTDEEFENIRIEKGLPKGEGVKPLDIKPDKNRPKDEDKDPTIITPWDVIGG